MRLIPHLEALEAKANAIVPISAVDIEAEERRHPGQSKALPPPVSGEGRHAPVESATS